MACIAVPVIPLVHVIAHPARLCSVGDEMHEAEAVGGLVHVPQCSAGADHSVWRCVSCLGSCHVWRLSSG